MVGVLDWTGLGVTIVGATIGALGLVFAFLARRAAKSAEEASIQARRAVTRTWGLVDLQRAIGLIERLKTIHRDQRWDAGLQHYQSLREMLHDIAEALPTGPEPLREGIVAAIPQITALENSVSILASGDEIPGLANLNEPLNSIQEHLERVRSSMMFSDDSEG